MNATPEPDWFDAGKPYDDDQIMDPIIKPDPNLTEEQRDAREAAYMETYYAFWADYFGPTRTAPEAAHESGPHLRPLPTHGDTTHDTLTAYVASAITEECERVRAKAEGGRNNQLNASAYTLGRLLDPHRVNAGQLSNEIAEQLLEAATQRTNPLPFREATRTIESGLKSGMETPRDLSHVGYPHPPVTELPNLARPEETGTGLTNRFAAKFLSSPGLDTIPERQYLVQNLLQRDSLAWLYGPSGTKKSFLALSLCAAISLGHTWANHDVPQLGPVLYVTSEGERTIRERARAWEALHGGEIMGVTFLPGAVHVTDPLQRAEFLESLDMIADGVPGLDDVAVAGALPSLIVIDTQARATAGIDENDNAEMGRFVDALQEIREYTGACVLTIHHAGKSGATMRGASSIDAAADTKMRVSNDGPWVDLTVEKQRDDECRTLRFHTVPIHDTLAINGSETLPPPEDFTPDERVINFLQSVQHSGASTSELVAACELPKNLVLPLLNQLVDDGRITSKGAKWFAHPTDQDHE